MKYSLSLLAAYVIPQMASAHPSGHDGGVKETAAHLLSQPDHLALIALAGAGAFAIYRIASKRKAAQEKAAHARIDSRS